MKKQLSILAIVSLLTAVPAFAADGYSMNEISGGTGASLSFSSGANTAFSLGAGYGRTLLDLSQSLPLQGTAIANFLTIGGKTTLSFVVGPTLNYAFDNTGINNAAYLTAAGGISFSNFSGTGSTDFAYHLEAGKRFEIVQNISWKPAFVMSGTTATGSNPQFQVVPVQFAFTF